MSTKAKTFRAHLMKHEPALWKTVVKARLASAALFRWPRKRMAGLCFHGSRDTPVGDLCGPMLSIEHPHFSEMAAWQGVPRKHLQYDCDDRDVWWAKPDTGDPAALGLRLNLALASWGVLPPPAPGSSEAGVLARLITEEAAEKGDIASMERAWRNLGMDDPREYEAALFIAAESEHVDFVRALVRLVGPEVAHHAYGECDAAAIGFEISPSGRRQMATFLRAGIEVPQSCKVDVVMAFAEYLADRPTRRVTSATAR